MAEAAVQLPVEPSQEAMDKYFESRGTVTDGLPVPAETTPAAVPAPAPGETPPAPAVTPAPAPAPAPVAADEEEIELPGAEPKPGEPPPPKRRVVAFNKFKRTEEQLTATQQELATLKDQMSRADERMKLITEALQQTPAETAAQEEEDPAPDPDADIFGYARWQGRQLERLTTSFQEMRQAQEGRLQEEQLANWYKTDAEQFYRTKEPAFGLAYVHLMRNRDAELLAGGVEDQAERMRIIAQEERSVIDKARKDRVSPAERIYELAVGRGFDKDKAIAEYTRAQNGGTPAPAPAPAAAPAPAPAAAPAAPAVPGTPLGAAPATPNVAAEIERIKAAQAGSTSLSGGGGAPAENLTPQMLADMPMDEFTALMNRLSKSKMRELMGS